MKTKLGYLVSVLIITAMFCIGFVNDAWADTPKGNTATDTICKGVFVDTVEIGGKTKEEAEQLVSQYLEELLGKKITVKANEKEASSNMKDMGAEFVNSDYVNQALNIGKIGNVVEKYKDIKDVENDKKIYEVEVSLPDDKLNAFVKDKATTCNIEAKEPTMVPKSSRISGGDIASQFTYQEGSEGKSIDEKKVKEQINKVLKKWDKKDVVIEAEVEVTKPKHSIEELKNCNAKLGTFTTSYGSSSYSRSNNISNAAGKINGKVLYVGEVFSMLSTVTPFTKANGYYEAGSYAQGKVVDSIGGGVCQVSSTLYNAVLRAELEIVRRSNHSMIVSYVPISADAMISEGGGSDFKFKNNTDAPVYIEAYTAGKTVTFNIYGHETRSSSRTIKFENKILQKIQPGSDVITKDKSQPKSYRKVTQSSHIGYRAEYYKIIYENGVETKRVKVNSSYYKASPNYITVGDKDEAKATPAPSAPQATGGTEVPTQGSSPTPGAVAQGRPVTQPVVPPVQP